MASSKAPKHDFAPAWLKIPDQSSQKPTGAKSSEHQEKASFQRRKDFPFEHPHGGNPTRQRSFDQYFDERHYSGQDYYDKTGYYNGYYVNGYPAANFHPGSGNFRDTKYPHSSVNGRFAQMNGAYPAYGYDFYPDKFTNGGRSGGGSGGRKTYHSPQKGDKDSHHGNAAKTRQEARPAAENGEHREEKSAMEENKEEEFPSLNGEAENKEDTPEKTKITGGVWDKYSKDKILQSTKQPNNNNVNSSKNADNCSKDIKQNHTAYFFKALIPTKIQSKSSKRGGKDSLKLSPFTKDINSNNSSFNRHSKENAELPSTPPMDILNTRLVTTPRKLGDKKSDFLKALKLDSGSKEEILGEGEQRPAGDVVNGVEETTGQQDGDCVSALSSSLEEEQRLLKSMGWREDDEQNRHFSQNELEDIEVLGQQLKLLKEQRNGLKRSLPKTWSPQHLPAFCPSNLPPQVTGHSSDSDCDAASN